MIEKLGSITIMKMISSIILFLKSELTISSTKNWFCFQEQIVWELFLQLSMGLSLDRERFYMLALRKIWIQKSKLLNFQVT